MNATGTLPGGPDRAPSRHADDQTQLSIVVPVFNEAQNVNPLLERLLPVLSAVTPSYQVLFVDDGSIDETAQLVKQASVANGRIELLSLTRNFGHQMALTAGLDYAAGNVVISMDGDLQHAPELIPELLRRYEEGNDVVYTIRKATAGEGRVKRLCSSAFYRIFNALSPVHIHEASSDFRLLSRRVVDVIRKLPENHRFLRGLIPWTGFHSAAVEYEAESRHAGHTKYSFARTLSMALDAAFSFSRVPLQCATLLGFLTTVGCLIYFVYSITRWFLGATVTGWTSLIASMLFIGGAQLLFVGILGEYLGRVYEQVKQRPLYVVHEYSNAAAASSAERPGTRYPAMAAAAAPSASSSMQ